MARTSGDGCSGESGHGDVNARMSGSTHRPGFVGKGAQRDVPMPGKGVTRGQNSEQRVADEVDALIAGVAAARPGLVVHRDDEISAAGVEELEAFRCLDLHHGHRQARPILREQAECWRDKTADGGGEGADGHVADLALVESGEIRPGPLELGLDHPGVAQQQIGLRSEPDPPAVSDDEWHPDRACQRGDLLGHRRGAEMENPCCRGDRLVVSQGPQGLQLPEIDHEVILHNQATILSMDKTIISGQSRGMTQTAVASIAIVGDRNPSYLTHTLTEEAFSDLGVRFEWVPTPVVLEDPTLLGAYGGCLMAPGTPYASMSGALEAIRYAREHDLALLGTCGGFQHVLIEIARNLAAIAGADHAEVNPDASELVCVPLTCSLVGQQHPVRIEPGTRAAAIYGTGESIEPFFCNFGLNDAYRPALEAAGVCYSGFDAGGEPRILELPDHRFFLATLYVPQASSRKAHPHPVLNAFVDAAAATVAST